VARLSVRLICERRPRRLDVPFLARPTGKAIYDEADLLCRRIDRLEGL
jgi:hypothetical protein